MAFKLTLFMNLISLRMIKMPIVGNLVRDHLVKYRWLLGANWCTGTSSLEMYMIYNLVKLEMACLKSLKIHVDSTFQRVQWDQR